MSASAGPDIVSRGLVTHFDATNSKSMRVGSSKWIDLVNDYDASQVGSPSIVTSVIPSYIQDFTNSSYYQISNLAGPGTSDFTFSFWVYFTNVTTQASTLLTIDSSGTGLFIIRANFSTSSTVYVNGSGATQFALTVSNGFETDKWYNIVVTRNSNTVNAYNNAVKSGSSGTLSDNITGTPLTYTLGNLLAASGQFLVGRYGVFQYYNVALTDEEIKRNFNALRGRFGI